VSIKRLNGAGIYGSKSNKAWDQTTTLNDFQSIATVVVPSGGQSSVTFSNIPSTFTHLQIRCLLRSSDSGASAGPILRLNSDSGSNYVYHLLSANGSSVGAAGVSNQTFEHFENTISNGSTANAYGAMIIDILDYSNTNKYKTTRTLNGWDANGSGQIALASGLWQSTSTVSSITLTMYTSSNFMQYSSFALYGIKVAS
jgi:hypothetical protein